VSGTGFSLYNTVSGPSEVIFPSSSTGISCFAHHQGNGYLAFAPVLANGEIEIIDIKTRDILYQLSIPATAEVVSMDFSRNGAKLFVITSAMDAQIIVYDLLSNRVLVKSPLTQSYIGINVNPADDSMAALYGDEGTTIVMLREINGEYSFYFESIYVAPDYRGEADMNTRSEEEKLIATTLANATTSVIWLPYDYLLIGNKQGMLTEVLITEHKKMKVLRKNNIKKLAPLTVAQIFVTSMVIAHDFLVVCTSVGGIYYFGLRSFQAVPTQDTIIVDFTQPLQIANVPTRVNTIVFDITNERLMVGTCRGDIVVVPALLQESDEVGDQDDYGADAVIENTGPITVEPGQILALNRDAIVVSQPLLFTLDSKKTLPTFVLASFDGTVSFWTQPQVSDEYFETRKSSGVLSLAGSKFLGSFNSGLESNREGTYLCSMEVLPFRIHSQSTILALGTDSGWLELWECKMSGGDDNKPVCTKIAQRHFYNTPLNLISASSFSGKQGNAYVVAVASSGTGSDQEEDCSIVHVCEVHNCAEGAMFEVRNVYQIAGTEIPSALNWYGDTLIVSDSGGKQHQFSSTNAQLLVNKISFPVSISSWDLGLPTEEYCLGTCMIGSKDSSLISFNSGATVFNHAEMASLNDIAISNTHDNIIVCAKPSSNGKLLAIGCVDGSICVWERGSTNSFKLVYKFHVHADAITSLAFSQDTSVLLSTSLDGSVFCHALATSSTLKADTKAMKTVKDDRADKGFMIDENAVVTSPTWMQEKETNLLERAKFENKENVAKLMSGLKELGEKHAKLLAENETREDLEKLDLSDFVVDVGAREVIMNENNSNADASRKAYIRANLWNELIASRLKKAFWDNMDIQSRPLHPIVNPSKNIIMTAFSVKKVTEEEMLLLEKLKLLRCIEIKSMQAQGGIVVTLPNGKKRVTWSKDVAGFPETTSWIALEGMRWPCEDLVEMLEARKKS
jgi:WD40 repeat protein